MTCALGCVWDEGIRCKSGAWKRSRHCMRLPRAEKSGHWGNLRRLRGGRGSDPGSISRKTYDDGKAARFGRLDFAQKTGAAGFAALILFAVVCCGEKSGEDKL